MSPATTVARPLASGRSLWITAPAIDLLIGCGGWSAPVLLFASLIVNAQAERWAVVFYALALVCNYPHYMATIHRAYARIDDRAAYLLFTHYVTAGLVTIGVAAHVWPRLVPWLFTAYVMWSPWHYAGQNFGLSMMFLRRAGITPTRRERERLHAAFIASFVLLLAALNQGASADRVVLSLGLPAWIAWPVEISAATVFVGGSLLAFGSLSRRVSFRTLVPALTLLSTQALWFVVPVLIAQMSNAPAPQHVRYSSGALALMHSAQYLWITQHYARRDAERRDRRQTWSHWRYWTVLILGGIALFIPAPWLTSVVGHADFTTSALVVAAVVNIHHFVLDGVVWKLRDPRVSQTLVEAEDSPHLTNPGRPSTPGRFGRRQLAIGAASLALLVLAFIDQTRYLLTTRTTDTVALETARRLNPHDSRVHVRIAALASRRGAPAAAAQSLQDAIAANPYDPAPRHALVQLLVEGDRLTEAATVNSALVDLFPRDVEALVNAGVFAQRRGDVTAAIGAWRRALATTDDLMDVHVYLAELLDSTGRTAEALPHYQRHLELVAAMHQGAPDARRTTRVLIKFADALSRTGHADGAQAQYQLAAQIARARGLTDIEAIAARHIPASSP